LAGQFLSEDGTPKNITIRPYIYRYPLRRRRDGGVVELRSIDERSLAMAHKNRPVDDLKC